MNRKTLKALKASIEHWEENCRAETTDDVSVGANDCALCDEYHTGNHATACVGCPVWAKTGEQYCRRTPYGAAKHARLDWGWEPTPVNRAKFRRAARREVNFLKSLLPENKS